MRFLPIATWRFLLGVFVSRWASTCEKGGLRLGFRAQKEDILLRGFIINLLISLPTFQVHAVSTASPSPVYTPRMARRLFWGCLWLGREAPLHLFDNDIKREIIIAIIF